MHPASLQKYRLFPPVRLPDRTWPDRVLDRAPEWCSVDLRDGNQALPQPMSVEEKLEFFDLLCRVGFKQIEVGFPSAADSEFNFCRRLIEENRIPADVTIQVLVQTREHLIRKTFAAIDGAKRAIVHIYNSTSPLQRRVTFGDATRESIRDIAVDGARLVRELAPTVPDTEVVLQYSPESFSDTELDFALECCHAVMDVWQPAPDKKIILNLPATVEWTTPNVHADQIEWMCRNLKNRGSVILSLHTHNDRGTGVAATELGLLAGADRVEGTLFGNGERTGNLDIVTVALNLNSHGIPSGLDFADLPSIRAVYERVTRLYVPERQPYAGELVFTAFSGSHQDAIKKGLDRRARETMADPAIPWGVPYLTIDPRDIGRSYEAIIRINSQSGKGGVAYILEQEFGYSLPKAMHREIGRLINEVADTRGTELTPADVHEIFRQEYLERRTPLALQHFKTTERDSEVTCVVALVIDGVARELTGQGNGPIDAFTRALAATALPRFEVLSYVEHSLGKGSEARAVSYIQIKTERGQTLFGAGIDTNIELASIKAIVSALNRALAR